MIVPRLSSDMADRPLPAGGLPFRPVIVGRGDAPLTLPRLPLTGAGELRSGDPRKRTDRAYTGAMSENKPTATDEMDYDRLDIDADEERALRVLRMGARNDDEVVRKARHLADELERELERIAPPKPFPDVGSMVAPPADDEAPRR